MCVLGGGGGGGGEVCVCVGGGGGVERHRFFLSAIYFINCSRHSSNGYLR